MATDNYGFPVPDASPDAGEKVYEAILKLSAAIVGVDEALHEQAGGLAGKAEASHSHEIGEIVGLQNALNGKMSNGKTFAFTDLSDGEGLAETPNGYLIGRVSGKFVPLSPAAALGAHGHAIGDITNLASSLASLLSKSQNLADLPDAAEGRTNLGLSFARIKWLSKAIGEFYFADSGETGVDIPPTNDPAFRFVELTAGKTGGGQYNAGCLGSESVSGSAPLVLATAVVTLDGSPMLGQTIDLINTEGRFLRASTSAGSLQHDQMQAITGRVLFQTAVIDTGSNLGAFSASSNVEGQRGANGSGTTANVEFNSANSPGARAGTETRAKNVGVRVFRRIK